MKIGIILCFLSIIALGSAIVCFTAKIMIAGIFLSIASLSLFLFGQEIIRGWILIERAKAQEMVDDLFSDDEDQ